MKKHYEKSEAGEIVIQNRFVKWVDNFWYHYKWPVIIIGFFLLVGVVCFAQCASGESHDYTVAYAGGYTLQGEEAQLVAEVLAGVAPQSEEIADPTVAMNSFTVFTEEEIRALCTDEEGRFSTYAFNSTKQTTMQNLDQFGTYVKTGDAAVWLVSEYVYTTLNLSKIAVPLSELYETAPAAAYDEYAVRLKDTAIYQYYDALKVLPEDTLIVMPHSLVWGASSNGETYELFLEMYRAIVEFQPQ